MTTQQPEALRLAELIDLSWPQPGSVSHDAASELRRLHAENQELKEQMAAIGAGGVEPLRKRAAPAVLAAQEENHGEHLFDAVLNCPHSITHESVTLHFCQKQKEGHNALSQLRHRLAAHDLAARQRELQLLGEIEALERLALNVLKQLGEEAAPQAVQAAVPLPLLVRDIARDLGITVPQACIALKPLGNYSTNSAVTAEMARMLRDHFPAPAHPAEGVPAQTTRDAVIQHLTNAGVLEHDGCGIFIASANASELIEACMALCAAAHTALAAQAKKGGTQQ